MKELKYTLLTDGTSDKALIDILNWLLQECGIDYAIQPEWADLSRLSVKPKSLSERIINSLELYPCDLLFVHRDAEKEDRQNRVDEIQEAIDRVNPPITIPYAKVEQLSDPKQSENSPFKKRLVENGNEAIAFLVKINQSERVKDQTHGRIWG
jgi:hypothetical protein